MPQRGARKTILLVEDDLECQELFAHALELAGYEVALARHGRAALEWLETGKPDLIVLDVHMPEMDGYAFRRAQLENPTLEEIPVLVVTGDFAALDRKLLPAAAYLPKPITRAVLLAAVARLIATPSLFRSVAAGA